MLICLGVQPSYAEKRVALVIGNNIYANLPADQQLRKAVNDSRAVGKALSSLGFEVISGENLGRQALVDKFYELAQRLSPGDTAFFFFAGHGVALGGGNYILPADVPSIADGQELRLAHSALSESDIISDLERRVSDLQTRRFGVAVLVLDACRNNPFRRPGLRGVGANRGLIGRSETGRGVFTIYSAGIGQMALDRLTEDDPSPNSVFTRVLVPALVKPGIDLTALAFEVREDVSRLAATIKYDQRPAYYDETIGGRVYLAGLHRREDAKSTEPPTATATPAVQIAMPQQSSSPGKGDFGGIVPKPATSQIATVAPPAVGLMVHLFSMMSEAQAVTAFRSLQAKFPDQLADKSPRIRRADLGSKWGIVYRVMIGPFETAQEASQFCASYKAAGGQCMVRSN
jgi:hypothetical protein